MTLENFLNSMGNDPFNNANSWIKERDTTIILEANGEEIPFYFINTHKNMFSSSFASMEYFPQTDTKQGFIKLIRGEDELNLPPTDEQILFAIKSVHDYTFQKSREDATEQIMEGFIYLL